jgi:hypothetical protein
MMKMNTIKQLALLIFTLGFAGVVKGAEAVDIIIENTTGLEIIIKRKAEGRIQIPHNARKSFSLSSLQESEAQIYVQKSDGTEIFVSKTSGWLSGNRYTIQASTSWLSGNRYTMQASTSPDRYRVVRNKLSSGDHTAATTADDAGHDAGAGDRAGAEARAGNPDEALPPVPAELIVNASSQNQVVATASGDVVLPPGHAVDTKTGATDLAADLSDADDSPQDPPHKPVIVIQEDGSTQRMTWVAWLAFQAGRATGRCLVQ